MTQKNYSGKIPLISLSDRRIKMVIALIVCSLLVAPITLQFTAQKQSSVYRREISFESIRTDNSYLFEPILGNQERDGISFEINPEERQAIKQGATPDYNYLSTTTTTSSNIIITNNDDFSTLGFQGQGTIDEPYIIEQLEITDPSNVLIDIQGTTAYFVIRNCLLNSVADVDTENVGIRLDSVGNGEIYDNYVYNGWFGIHIINSNSINITRNDAYQNQVGIYLVDSNEIVVEGNDLYTNSYGAYLRYSDNSLVTRNEVFNNSLIGIAAYFSKNNDYSYNNIYNNDQDGIYFISHVDNNSISNNYIYDNLRYGFYISYSINNTIEKNQIRNNTDSGIWLISAEDNDIIENDISESFYGLYFYSNSKVVTCARNYIYKNDIHDNNRGIWLWLYVEENLFEMNFIHENIQGFYSRNTEHNILQQNLFYKQSAYAFKLDALSNDTIIERNDFIQNLEGITSQAGDDGERNIIQYNYWDEWTTPDSDEDGIVDLPYAILGLANNEDPYPLACSFSQDSDSDGLTDYDEINIYGTHPFNWDTDDDRLSDGEEVLTFGTDPLDPLDPWVDSDGDWLHDWVEINDYGTDPFNWDTDDDGLSDGEEVLTFGTDPLDLYDPYYPWLDSDGDGLYDHDEITNHGTDPLDWDSDGDDLPDGYEVTNGYDPLDHLDPYGGWVDADSDGLHNSAEIDFYGTDPYDSDTDGDGLKDGIEVTNGYDPLDPLDPWVDSDGDGLHDHDEITNHGTEPTDWDTDGDGLSDGEEVNILGTNPLEWYDPWIDSDGDWLHDLAEINDYGTDPFNWDTDDDGYSDGEEVNTLETDPLDFRTPWFDSDGDGLHDYAEINLYGTDPTESDTDGDGLSDYDEIIFYGTDPLEPVDNYTDEGTDVIITDPNTDIELEFDTIAYDGATTIVEEPSGPALPTNFELLGQYYSITTTASYSGLITIRIPYVHPGGDLPAIFHYHNGEWVMLDTTYDPVAQVLIAQVDSFSYFAVLQQVIIAESVLSPDIFYQEGSHLYIITNTDFTLEANITEPYFTQFYYRINGGEWLVYTGSFSLTGPVGDYLIEFYGVDLFGVVEEPHSVIVTLVSLDIDSYFDNCPDGSFDVIFRYDKQAGVYELVATNPGVFIYFFEMTNTWPIDLDDYTINLLLPDDFLLSGTNPIHIYLDGVDITSLCIIDGTVVTIHNIPVGGKITVETHLKFALRGSTFVSLEEFAMKNYYFEVYSEGATGDFTIPSEGLFGCYSTSLSLIALQKKITAIAGYIMDVDGNPLAGLLVELYDNTGTLVGFSYSDELGFYYFLDLESGEYELKVYHDVDVHIQVATAIDKELVIVDFII